MFSKIPLAGVSNAEWLRLRKSGIGGSDAGGNLRREPLQQRHEGIPGQDK